MEKVSNVINHTLKDLMVNCMLNENNKALYIENLTCSRIEAILNKVNDKEFDELFWDAFKLAKAYRRASVSLMEQALKEFVYDCCPECGCVHYTPGSSCPNCDYISYL